ncbi:MAG: Tetratricopeptide repeat [Planctomycetota bacterium]|jgi:tetratricopeptide (TPR) repeat protein
MPDHPNDDVDLPEVMFLPMAVHPKAALEGVDLEVLARRLPDFVHQVLNQGQSVPTAMLELQTSGEGGATWLRLDAPPDREEAFELVPDDVDVRAVVVGEIAPRDNGLFVEFHVLHDEVEGFDENLTEKVAGTVPLANPVPVLLRIARHLARLLGLQYHEPPRGLMTENGEAFRLFLLGLDNAMLLSGDLDIAVPEDRESLMRPFAEALALDPGFGLALRVANATTVLALDGSKLDGEAVRRFLDACYSAQPGDGDGCVAIAEHLVDLGDDQRAMAWLEHAAHLDPPPAKSLESLGLLLARRGDTRAATDLWERGLEVDGHPDFFSHLAQVRFAEDRDAEAWELVRRGLVRLRERTLRSGEWDSEPTVSSTLLECLSAHLQDRAAPIQIAEALVGLVGLMRYEARVHLGLCLLGAGRRAPARRELKAALDGLLDRDVRDRAVRALLRLDVDRFELRFARAVAGATHGKQPRRHAADFRDWLRMQEEFWPAMYFLAVIERREGNLSRAADLLFAALAISPGQPEVQLEMAEVFALNGNPKRALELAEEAAKERAAEPRFVAAQARYLLQLGRREDAKRVVEAAFATGLDGKELRKIGRELKRAGRGE